MIGYDGHKRIKDTKLHAIATPSSLPICVSIGPGNEHEARRLIPMMEGMEIKSKRRARKRPKRIHADTNYDTPLVRFYLAKKGVRANIPCRSKKSHRGRPRFFDREALRRTRYTVERFFGWIKEFRRIDTRFDRLASSFMGFIHIACILILMNQVLR